MKSVKNSMKKDVLSIAQKIGPYIPALVISQVLPSKTAQNHLEGAAHDLITFLLDKKYSLLTVVFISGLFLAWMRDSTIDDVKEESKNFSFIDKSKPENNPFNIHLIDGSDISFTQLDDLISFVRKLPNGRVSDRAQKSFRVARRALIQGWVDPYFAEVSVFLCIRSLEQLLHDLFPKSTDNSEFVQSISTTKTKFINDEVACRFVREHLGQNIDITAILQEIVDFRHSFAHRDEPNAKQCPINLSSFQLVSTLLQYRDSIT